MRKTLIALILALLVALPTSVFANTQLVGYSSVGDLLDSNVGGTAEAFKFTATASGTAAHIWVYLDPSAASQPATVKVALYSNSSGQPGSLLTSGSLSSPVSGWNDVSVSSASVTANTVYWIAVMSPYGDTLLYFRDTTGGISGTNSYTSSSQTLTSFPSTWSSGTGYDNTPVSAYVTT